MRIVLPGFLLLTCTLTLSACLATAGIAPEATRTAAPTAPRRVITRTPCTAQGTPRQSSPSPTSTVPGCRDQPGEILHGVLRDPRLARKLPFRLYLPPCFHEEPGGRYPVLYLLHGLGSSDGQWDELGVNEHADELIHRGQTPPWIIVMPWLRHGLNPDTAVTEVLIPAIDEGYPTRPDRGWRAIGGLSRGGAYALRLGLRHPRLFGALGLHSPANLYSETLIDAWVEEIPSDSKPRLWIGVGQQDPLYQSTQDLAALMQELGFSLSVQVYPGGHEPAYWSAHMEEYLLWYTSTWNEAYEGTPRQPDPPRTP